MSEPVVFGVSDFVALVNQTLEFAYSQVTIVGELANFKVSKNKWVYFDLKDEFASVHFFGTVYTLPGPLEDGMVLEVRGSPRLHPQFGFSVTVQSLRPVGKGSIKRAARLLEAKLRAEGLFDSLRKRPLPYPPASVGVITSKESAAYSDFIKILGQRWRGLDLQLIDVQVQGEAADGQIIAAIEHFNQLAVPPEVLVLMRGGGSTDDLRAFSSEPVTRAVAASRIPTLVAIGHETDMSLAEQAADLRASTPSNAAELLVPDRHDVKRQLRHQTDMLNTVVDKLLVERRGQLRVQQEQLEQLVHSLLAATRQHLEARRQLVTALSPTAALRRGYAVVRNQKGYAVRSGRELAIGEAVAVQFSDTVAGMQVTSVELQ